MSLSGHTGQRSHYVLTWSFRLAVCSFVTKLVNIFRLFRKRMNQFLCKLAQVVHGQARNDQRWGSGGQRSRSREDKDWFGGVMGGGHHSWPCWAK